MSAFGSARCSTETTLGPSPRDMIGRGWVCWHHYKQGLQEIFRRRMINQRSHLTGAYIFQKLWILDTNKSIYNQVCDILWKICQISKVLHPCLTQTQQKHQITRELSMYVRQIHNTFCHVHVCNVTLMLVNLICIFTKTIYTTLEV